MKQKNILFVCKNNLFRSKIAEVYFNEINKNKKIKSSSAGVFQGEDLPKKTLRIVKKLGINIKGKPRAMSSKLLKEQDLIVIVANDVPKYLFKHKPVKKLVRFGVEDVYNLNEKKIIKAVKQVMNKMDNLNKKINQGKIKW